MSSLLCPLLASARKASRKSSSSALWALQLERQPEGTANSHPRAALLPWTGAAKAQLGGAAESTPGSARQRKENRPVPRERTGSPTARQSSGRGGAQLSRAPSGCLARAPLGHCHVLPLQGQSQPESGSRLCLAQSVMSLNVKILSTLRWLECPFAGQASLLLSRRVKSGQPRQTHLGL